MTNLPTTMMIMVFSIPIVAIICGTISDITKRKSKKSEDPEQARMIQEIYHGLERMEKRVEALETILYETRRDR